MSVDQTTQRNPVNQGPKPPFPAQPQEPPGLEQEMRPKPDYGLESYRGSGRLTGKKAIVTGGDSGIGRAVALAFAREGADVLISYLPSEEPDAQEIAQAVRESGRTAITVPGDIRDEELCRQIVERAVQEFGTIDILVNNAAHQMTFQGIEEIPSEELGKTFETNIYAMFYLCKAAVPHMPEGGTIINTTSVQAYQPSSSLLIYAMTKAAIANFTKALSQELIKKGIRVNAVAPGPVWTPLNPATAPVEKVEQFGKSAPEGRPAQPVELSPVYVFLASQESSYITGEIIGVTGGTPIT
jgi:NAD(P)-dependent dehydrogenase (short-subunit alcohol dehydrogenase family)